MADSQKYSKFTIESLRDPSTKGYGVSTYDRDMKAIVRAVKQSLPRDAFYSVGEKEINKQGKLTLDIYTHSDSAGIVSNSIDVATKKMFHSGSEYERYKVIQRKSISSAEQRALIKEELSRNNEAERKDKAQLTRGTGIHLLKITALLTLIGNITRRILTNVLDRASESVAVATSAHDAGISYRQAMEFTHAETKAGLPSGTFMNAIKDLQSKLVDEFSLDSNAISSLGVLLGSDLQHLVQSQLKAGNGVEALALILDKVNAIVSSGMSPAGSFVGTEAARVKMLNYLDSMFPQLATIFSKMQEQATNVNSIYSGTFDVNDFSSWLDALLNTNNRNYGTVEQGLVQTMGDLNNSIKDLWERLKESITVTLSPVLIPILRKIANLRFGLSESENLRLDKSNYVENEAYQRELEGKLALLPTDTTGMSAKEKAQLQATREMYEEEIRAVKEENENLNKGKHVMNMRRTPNELSRDIGVQYSRNVYLDPFLYSEGNSEAYLEALRDLVYSQYTPEEIRQARREASGYTEEQINKEVAKKIEDEKKNKAGEWRTLLEIKLSELRKKYGKTNIFGGFTISMDSLRKLEAELTEYAYSIPGLMESIKTSDGKLHVTTNAHSLAYIPNWARISVDENEIRRQYEASIEKALDESLPIMEEIAFLQGLSIDAGKLAEREAAVYAENDILNAENNKFFTATLAENAIQTVADEMIKKGTSGYLVGSNVTSNGERKGEVYLVIKDDKTGEEVGRKLIYSGSGQTVYEGEIDMIRKGTNGDWMLNMTTNNAKQTPASSER